MFDSIGRASEYPLSVSNGSGLVIVGDEVLKASISQILTTPVGSLPQNPYFGSELFRILFQPIDAVAISAGKTFIAEALKKWEKRIIIKDIEGVVNNENKSISFNILYLKRGTNASGVFVFPFYREI